MPALKNGIRFLLPWRGREPGDTNRELDLGLMETLVAQKRAEWIQDESEDEPAKPKRRKK